MHGFLNKLLKNKVKYVDKIRLKIDEKFRKNLCQKNYGQGFFKWIKFTIV